jgi:hypothetical protein
MEIPKVYEQKQHDTNTRNIEKETAIPIKQD